MKNLNRLKLKRVVDISLYYQTLRIKRALFKTSSYLAIIFFLTAFLFSASLELVYIALSLAVLLEIISYLAYEGILDNFIVKHIQKKQSYT